MLQYSLPLRWCWHLLCHHKRSWSVSFFVCLLMLPTHFLSLNFVLMLGSVQLIGKGSACSKLPSSYILLPLSQLHRVSWKLSVLSKWCDMEHHLFCGFPGLSSANSLPKFGSISLFLVGSFNRLMLDSYYWEALWVQNCWLHFGLGHCILLWRWESLLINYSWVLQWRPILSTLDL